MNRNLTALTETIIIKHLEFLTSNYYILSNILFIPLVPTQDEQLHKQIQKHCCIINSTESGLGNAFTSQSFKVNESNLNNI